jgi:hypothetical protein
MKLEKELTKLLRDFDLQSYEGFTISRPVLMQIVHSSREAVQDIRNSYPHTVSGLKHISNLCYWIMRLKPVNSSALKRKGRRISDVAINEKIALYWALQKILRSIKEEKLRELVTNSKPNIARFRYVVRFFLKEDLYTSISEKQQIKGTSKFVETVHHCRFKKITAINLYETFMQLIMSVQMDRV